MRYAELVRRLESRHMMPERPPGLETTREGLRRLGLALDPRRVILVAGTNGKGSTAAALEALLAAAGERVGLYTSPHLVSTTERFRINGRDISEELFVRAHDAVERRLGDLVPTHFEMLTLMAAWLFSGDEALPPVDRLLLETGLGGRWDATNAVPHGTVVLTRIGFDHQNLLGSTLTEIARNKLDTLVPPARLLVHGTLADSREPEARAVDALASEYARERGVRAVRAPAFGWRAEAGSQGPRFFLESRWGEAELALPGARGAENANLALAALDALGIDPRPHLGALARVRWPGRMQRLERPEAPCPVYLSGDHNLQGVASLLDLLPHYRRPGGRVHFVVGIGADKDAPAMLDRLSSVPGSRLYLTVTPFKGLRLGQYPEHALERAAAREEDPLRALAHAEAAAGADDLVVVTGSLYLVGEILARASRGQAAILNSSSAR